MDRAAFLRSLDFLRPLPPTAWDGTATADGNDGEGPYSGSTITPPTPSKSNALLLFEDLPVVVSIEPMILVDITANGGPGCTWKRGRGEDALPDKLGGSAIGPAFFQSHSTDAPTEGGTGEATSSKMADATAEKEDAMDVEPDNDQGCEGAAQRDHNLRVNADPSLCTFEAAIVKRLPTAMGDGNEGENVLATPTGRTSAGREMTELESKALVFRFGGHFVFQVDESAILEVRHESGQFEAASSNNSVGDGTESQPASDDEQPPSKKQRNEGDGSSRTDKEAANAKKLPPPSLVIVVGSCALRVFSLEETSNESLGPDTDADADTTRPSSRIWSTLTKTAESVDNRLKKVRSVLMQQFGIENDREGNKHTWRMAPPGSGVAFHSWPESFGGSSFNVDKPKCKEPSFLEEDWLYCLGKRHVECPSAATSPQKSSSPSKASSSSFEHGQKEPTPQENGSSQPKSKGINGSSANVEPSHSSELTHESMHDNGKDGKHGAQLKESQSPLVKEAGHADIGSGEEDGERSQQSDAKCPADDEEKEAQNGVEADITADPTSWRDEVCDKHNLFETSAAHMERAMATMPSQRAGSSISYLTSCAESLSHSYLTAKGFVDATQQCENDIDNATCEMEEVLDKMFPARGRKAIAVQSEQSGEDYQSRVEELMRLRKEAVATKFALLMTPKR